MAVHNFVVYLSFEGELLVYKLGGCDVLFEEVSPQHKQL